MIELVVAVLLIMGAVIGAAYLIGAVMLALAGLAWIAGLALNVVGWIFSAFCAAVAAFDP